MEKLCTGWGVQGVGVLILLGGFFSAKFGSSVSAKFFIYRAHAVCFCPLVTILDPPEIILIDTKYLYIFIG
jgi:hypothetical protein